MKKTLILAGLAILSTPAFAQTTTEAAPAPPTTQAPPTPAEPMQQPAGGNVANTALSDSSSPSSGPRAQQGNTPANSATEANMSPAATSPDMTPVEQPLARYPICKAQQFDNCMEPGNGGAPAKKAKKRRAR